MSISPTILLRAISAQLQMSAGIFSYRLKKCASNGQAVILMYHRVIEPSETDEYVEPGMYVTPKTFEMHMKLLKKYFDVVSLQHLVEAAGTKSKKPLCAITIDDGWHDFYKNAYPIIQEKKIPATVFLPTSFIGTKQWFWTDRLATILKKSAGTPAVQTSADGIATKITQLPGSLFSRIDSAIKLLKPHSQDEIQKVLDELEHHCSSAPLKRAFLDWFDCRTLKKSGLVYFGSHTANHIILTSENEQKCKAELDLSKRKLLDEELVDPDFIPFCYPNGGFSEMCARMVEETEYHCAVTTKRGWVDGKSDRFTLNRVGIHQDMTASKALMLTRITGSKK